MLNSEINSYAQEGFIIDSIHLSGEGILLKYLIIMSKEVRQVMEIS